MRKPFTFTCNDSMNSYAIPRDYVLIVDSSLARPVLEAGKNQNIAL